MSDEVGYPSSAKPGVLTIAIQVNQDPDHGQKDNLCGYFEQEVLRKEEYYHQIEAEPPQKDK